MNAARPDRLRLLEVHLAVLLFGAASLFGKFLALWPLVIVLGRSAFAAAALALFSLAGWVTSGRRPRFGAAPGWLLLSGAVLAYHWVSFFQSVQVSTVAVGLLTFSSFPLFVTLLEAGLRRRRPRRVDLITALLVLAGLACIVPRFDFGDHITRGACWGVSSGFTFAVLSLMNRHLVRQNSPVVLAAGQNFFAAAILLLLLAFLPKPPRYPTPRDWMLLAVLGIVCTAIAHTLFIKGMARVSAQLASVIAGMETVYGAGFAFLFLGEIPSWRTVIGGTLILTAVLLGTLRHQPTTIEAPYSGPPDFIETGR